LTRRRVIFTVDMGFQTMPPPPAENFAARVFLGPALRAQPDRRLVDLVRDGYDAAFEEIVRRYRRPLDRFAAAIVGGHSEDVTQDAFSKALLALRGSEAEIELRPWLYRIVRNTALNDLRDSAPAATEELPEEGLAGAPSAAAEAESREELAELMERVRALPEPQRAALVMRELEGLSHEEIAAALGLSGGAARQAIYRARSALRNGLGLLVPLPLLRVLAEHGGEAAAAGGAVAGASAGGAALGGGTAAKVGVATVLVVGAAGAGVAVEQRGGGDGRAPEAAQAAPATPGSQPQGTSGGSGASDSSGGSRGSSGPGGGGDDSGGPGRGGEERRDERADRREDRRDERVDRREDRRDDREDSREDRVDDREDRVEEDRSGPSGSSSSGSSGSSGSGSSGSGNDFEVDDDNSGSGSGGEVEIEPPEEPEVEEPEVEEPDFDDDSSGSGSGDFDDD
jgi:RNA polymerase sigma factor (sigma-70 family)